MTRFLSLLALIGYISSPTFAESDVPNSVEPTAAEFMYAADVYECDDELYGVPDGKKAKKEMGKVYRICFEPNQVAKDAGVGIKNVETWEWSTSHKDGDVNQPAVIDGAAVEGLSHLECLDEGKKCFMDTFFGSEFYRNAGAALGKGEVSFTKGTGTVEASIGLFSVKFSIKFENDGEILSDEEMTALMEKVNEHNSAIRNENDQANQEL